MTELVEGESGDEVSSSESRSARKPGFVHGWTPETVKRAYLESADRMRQVLSFIANNPEQELSSERIARAIDAKYGWNTIAGMLGALGRRSANRYGRSLPMWSYRHDDHGRIQITMPAGAAEVIRGLT